MGKLRIIISDRGRQGIVTALTDGVIVVRRKRHKTATGAMLAVSRHLRRGHEPAFGSAVRDLYREALEELARSTPTGQAAD